MEIHAVTAGDRRTAAFRLSGGGVPDAAEGGRFRKPSEHGSIRLLRWRIGREDGRTRVTARESGYTPGWSRRNGISHGTL
jgi:hypothetical protein